MERTGPLQNITIIDCTMALAGPYGMGLLADMGANVIKVEPPHGDGSRSMPPLPPDYANVTSDEAAGVDYGGYFASINRNKRSIVLDLKDPKDKETLLALCSHADAIVENMRAGVMDRLGVGYEEISQHNPKIVYGCIRGFGDPRTGESPYAEWPAYDIVAQSMSGLAHITGPTGDGGYPSGSSVGDIYPGTLLALGVLAAVNHAKATGEGQFFDVAMYDAMLAFNETVVVNYGYNQTVLGARGQHHPNLMPFGIYPTKDGGVAIAAPGPGHWAALCKAIGREELIEDERTRNVHLRVRNPDVVLDAISAWTSTLTKSEVVAVLGGKVPCGPVNTAEDIYNDPHVEVRNMIRRFQLPGDNPQVGIAGSPIKFTQTPTTLYQLPPKLGEHQEEIMQQLDLWESQR